MRYLRNPGLALVLAAATACESDYSDRIIDIDAEGAVFVILYSDDNLSGNFNTQFDSPIIRVPLEVHRTASTIGGIERSTDSSGVAQFFSIPLGHYRVDVGSSILGDSLLRLDPDQSFTIVRRDTVILPVGVRFHSYTVSEARALPVGTKVWVRGTVLNIAGIFGDSTVHLTDTLASIRMSRLRPAPLEPGDSVQLLGTRAIRDGQPTFNVAAILIRGIADPLPPTIITAPTAASAQGGALDAAFVRVLLATVTDTATTLDGRLLTVNDGNGNLSVLLSNNINFGNLNQYVPNTRFDMTGLLVPDPVNPGTWLLKPRARADLVARPVI